MEEENQQLEGGAYEVIRARLDTQAIELRQKLERLNVERKEIFGAVESSLIATERVTTEHNCVPRDLMAIGANTFLFGYNIQFGLKTTTDINDVFGAYRYDTEAHTFEQIDIISLLGDRDFNEDFAYIYKYYKESVFVKMMVIGPHLYMAIRIGKLQSDIKTFKWLIKGDGTLSYVGNRFDHEYKFPDQHEFTWKRCNRDHHRSGEHPHISIEDKVFVETVGGDLTIKIEDNTADGVGVYSEEVMDKDQTLDDSEIYYAIVGPLILLKILPYREPDYRYFVFNQKNQSVNRIDTIGNSCVLLPEDHGIIFANGYYLLSGELKTFDHGLLDMRFERRISSANGEDTLYAFYNRASGDYVLLSYNLIEQTVETPVLCNGYSIFDNGELIYFKTEEEAQKYHTIQIWQTPILSADAIASQQKDESSYLFKIGNADIVTAMADCRELLTLLSKDDTYGGLYLDLMKKSSAIIDGYFWIDREETHLLGEPLKLIHAAAQSAIDEFDKVKRLRQAAKDRLKEASESSEKILRAAEHSPPDDIMGFVKQLSGMRTVRGEVIGLRELRYMDVAAVEVLEDKIIEATQIVSNKTVSFLLEPQALDPYRSKVDEQKKELGKTSKVTEIDALDEELDASGKELEMLIDVVSNLKIEDSTQTTAIIDSISSIYSTLNGVKTELKNKRRDLAKSEGTAQFSSQMKLLGQAVVNYLDLCDTTEKTDGYLTKVMVQIEELEGKFSEFDEYVEELTAKREEVYNAFEARKQQLLERRNKRANTLVKSAERVISGIKNRVANFEEINEINGYFAGDLMIEKVRDIITELKEQGDSVKADDIQTRLKTTREDAVRSLKDKNELYVDGTNIIQFGKNKFSVNTQELQLSIVPNDGDMCFHLSGTDFFEVITDKAFLATQDVWDQEVISENKEVYRVEYLVYQMLQQLSSEEAPTIEDVQAFMQPRYAEAYTKGVHDVDALKVLEAIVPIHYNIGLLRFDPKVRALAMLFWQDWSHESRKVLAAKVAAHGKRKGVFDTNSAERHGFVQDIHDAISEWVSTSKATKNISDHLSGAAEYLFLELTVDERFTVSPEAAEWTKKFQHALVVKHAEQVFKTALAELDGNAVAQYEVVYDWLSGMQQSDDSINLSGVYLAEAAAHLVRGGYDQLSVKSVRVESEVSGLIGSHKVVDGGNYTLHYNEFVEKLRKMFTFHLLVTT